MVWASGGCRDTTYVPAGPVPPEAMPIAAALAGKKLPLAGRIQITVIEAGQAVWLAFLNRELDLLERIPADFVHPALSNGQRRPNLSCTPHRLAVLVSPNTPRPSSN